MYKTTRFFSKAAGFIAKAKDDENYCYTLLYALETLSEKIDSQDREEAHYFLTNLSVLEEDLKGIADPSESHRIFNQIKKRLDMIINPDNYLEPAQQVDQVEICLPRLIKTLA